VTLSIPHAWLLWIALACLAAAGALILVGNGHRARKEAPMATAAEDAAAWAASEEFFRAARIWAEKAGVAFVIIGVLVGLGVVAGVHLALSYMFPWSARLLMVVFVAGGAALGWGMFRFLPWAFHRIIGRDV
jgi:hypothetical protein